ncbi:MAG TPA: hypothetical protein DEB31_06805 [Clostridiales bacterium]|nr:hypothetical protein [Clostridiales bacterium]
MKIKGLLGMMGDLKEKGFFQIFLSDVINKALNFVSGIIIINAVDKYLYGLYTNGFNIVSIFMLFTGLGVISGVLQFCSETREQEEKNAIYRFGARFGMLVNFLLCAAILIYGLWGALSMPEARGMLIALSFLPLVQFIYQYYATCFRTRKENKKYALSMNINTIGYVAGTLIGVLVYDVYGMIIGMYAGYLGSGVITAVMAKDIIKEGGRAKPLAKPLRRNLLHYSLVCCGSNVISQLLYLLDVFILGILVTDPRVTASYSVATKIPFALIFIPQAVIVFVYPYFAEHSTDFAWIKPHYSHMKKWMLLMNAVITVLGVALAGQIVGIFGEQYEDTVLLFRILMLSYFFSASFQLPSGNVLAMLRKVNINLVIAAVSGIANILLDIWLIQWYGSKGAAVATLSVVLISSVISTVYLNSHIKKGLAAQ